MDAGGRASRSSTIAASASAAAPSSSSRVSVVRAAARHPQREQDAHEPLLRAVVQVAPEPPALGVGGLDDPRA